MRKVMSLLILVALSLVIPIVSADIGEGCGMYGMMSGTYGLGFGIFGWLMSLLIVVLLVLLIMWLIKQIQKK